MMPAKAKTPAPVRGFLHDPAWIFGLVALLAGLVLVVLIPPMGGGNERFNLHRVVMVSSGTLLPAPAAVDQGMRTFIDQSTARFPPGSRPPYRYSVADFADLAAIPRGEQAVVLEPNAISVLHPVAYLPQLPVAVTADALGLRPIWTLYLGRLFGLLAGIGLIVAAIRVIPFHRHALAAVALLPTALFTRSTLDADQFTVGLAFLFLAQVIREAVAKDPIGHGALAWMAVLGFLLAQSKSAYLLLPMSALLIPAARFESPWRRFGAVALVVVPGLVASLCWMLALKDGYFEGARYMTYSGLVDPDAQLAGIVSAPLDYLAALVRSFVQTPLVPQSVIGFIGIFGPPVAMPPAFYPILAAALVAVVITGSEDRPPRLATPLPRLLALVLVGSSVLIVLTLLYLQWTRLGAPIIDGFQGRYLYPLAPLILILIPTPMRPRLLLTAEQWLWTVGSASAAGTLWVGWQVYWA